MPTLSTTTVSTTADPTVYGTLVSAYASGNTGDVDVTALASVVAGGAFVSKYHYSYTAVLEKAINAKVSSATSAMTFKSALSAVSADSSAATALPSVPTIGDFYHINTIATGTTGYLAATGLSAFEVFAGDNIVFDGTQFVTFDGSETEVTTDDTNVVVTKVPTTNGFSYEIGLANTVELVADTDVALTNLLAAYNKVVARLQTIEAYLAAVQQTTEVTNASGVAYDLVGSLPAWPTGYDASTAPTVAEVRGATGTFASNFISQ